MQTEKQDMKNREKARGKAIGDRPRKKIKAARELKGSEHGEKRKKNIRKE